MLDKDSVIFDDISLSDIFKKIYNNSDLKQKEIDQMVQKVGTLLTNITDATLLLPLLKEILDLSIKNDEQLVKMAGIIQRLLQVDNKPGSGGGFDLLPTSEQQQLLENVRGKLDEGKVDQQLKELDEKVKKAKDIIDKENKKLLNQVAEDGKK